MGMNKKNVIIGTAVGIAVGALLYHNKKEKEEARRRGLTVAELDLDKIARKLALTIFNGNENELERYVNARGFREAGLFTWTNVMNQLTKEMKLTDCFVGVCDKEGNVTLELINDALQKADVDIDSLKVSNVDKKDNKVKDKYKGYLRVIRKNDDTTDEKENINDEAVNETAEEEAEQVKETAEETMEETAEETMEETAEETEEEA